MGQRYGEIRLRDYQESVFDKLRALLAKRFRRIILCLPTGGGKTVVACALIWLAMQKGRSVVFVADREALVLQTSASLTEYGIPHGVAMGEHTYGRNEPIQVCSAQTLEKRGFWPHVHLVIVDEAHTIREATMNFIMESGKPTIGLTATPFTPGLGTYYEEIVNGSTTNELIAQKWLVPLRVYYGTQLELKGVRRGKDGEYSGKGVESRAIPITGDIISDWVRYTNREFGGPVKTLIFSRTIGHGEELCWQLNALGYRFEQISYKDKDYKERQNKIRALREGRLTGLVSVEALAKGFDVRDIKCLVLARPSRANLIAHIQALGRGMRSHPESGKEFCLVLDHVGNWQHHLAETLAFWAMGCDALDDSARFKKMARETPEYPDLVCKSCQMIIPVEATECPGCGTARPKKRVELHVEPGKMERYQGLFESVENIWGHVSHLALDTYPMDKARALRWACAQYKGLTGRYPPGDPLLEPLPFCDHRVATEVKENLRRWQKHQWARRRAQEKKRREKVQRGEAEQQALI